MIQQDEQFWEDVARQAKILYDDGEYKQAAAMLRVVLERGSNYYFAPDYADICVRNLDEQGHRFNEAAK